MNKQVPTNYSYYVYAGTIARVNQETYQLEIRKRTNGAWQEIRDPIIWERIQLEGDKVSETEAERLFRQNVS